MRPDTFCNLPYVIVTHYKYFYIFLITTLLLPVHLSAQSGVETRYASSDTAVQQSDTTRINISPRSAMIRSLIFPGWGQWYNGKKLKSVLIFSAEASMIAGFIIQHNRFSNSTDPELREFYLEDRNKFVWWLGGVIIYSMIDAYVDAYLQNFDIDMDIDKGNVSSVTVQLQFEFPLRTVF